MYGQNYNSEEPRGNNQIPRLQPYKSNPQRGAENSGYMPQGNAFGQDATMPYHGNQQGGGHMSQGNVFGQANVNTIPGFNYGVPLPPNPESHNHEANVYRDEKIPFTLNYNGLPTKRGIHIFFAELIATAALMFVGCMCVILDQKLTAYGFGFAVIIAVSIAGHISGAHLNPAVTITALIVQKIDARFAPCYFLGQFIGAIVGYGALHVIILNELNFSYEDVCWCCTNFSIRLGDSEDSDVVRAFFIEALMTMIVCLIYCGIWDSRNKNNSASDAIKLGFAVACITLACGPLTGASVNTFRSFVPALFAANFENQWIYYIAPNLGGIVAGVFYRFILTL